MKTLLFALLLSSSYSQAARLMVEAKHALNAKELAQVKGSSITRFTRHKHAYFSRLYVVSGTMTSEELQKLSWVKSVEATTEIQKLSLLPSDNGTKLVGDDLFSYQWSLLNEGQVYYREKDDIHNLPMIGSQNKDIGWKNLYQKIPKNRPLVAVLDSGVDLTHPELQGNLWKNEKECGKDKNVDNDGNQYAGDCDGWNFTEAVDSESAKNPQDNEGHGTHVAGIIAALQNNEGTVGVNPNALIMPVKVMKDTNSTSQVTSSESFAHGIIYATDQGAQVINLSLGWPKALETKFLREAVQYALQSGVVMVAAAGNNNSAEPLFPCAYDGVVCVAASTLNGNFAGFTNFGGHVDTVAPGEGILSLSPVLFEPEFFSVPKYDLKSGTSQAAPMVAGLLSILRAENKDILVSEILGRLYLSEKNPDDRKYIMGGDIRWDTLSQKVSTSVVRPVFKQVRQIVLTGDAETSKVSIPFRNFGLPTQNIQIKVESMAPGVNIDSTPVIIDSLAHAEAKVLQFAVSVNDMTSESNIKMKVTITDAEGVHTHFNEVPVVRDIRALPELKRFPFVFLDKILPVGAYNKEKNLASLVTTMVSYGRSPKHELFLKRTVVADKTIELTFFTRVASSMIEQPNKAIISNVSRLINYVRIDLDFDGKEDYVFQSIDTTGKLLIFSFFNEKLETKWPGFKDPEVIMDVNMKSLDNLNFMKLDHATLGKIMVPTFFTEGVIPKVDQTPDFFNRYDTSKEGRLYYLEPLVSENKLRIHTVTAQVWKDNVKSALNAKWNETVIAENILPVSSEDYKNGQVRIVFSVGVGTKRKIYISAFDVQSSLPGPALPQIVLQTSEIDPLYGITPTGLDSIGEVFLNIYDRSRGKIVTTSQGQQISQLVYEHDSETDLIAGHLASFQKGRTLFSILETRDELVSISHTAGSVIKTSRPKLRYSFLSSKMLSEMYTPVIFNREGTSGQALYVDSTTVTGNRLNLFEDQDGKLVSSISNSVLVPGGCVALRTNFSAEASANEFVFLCVDEATKSWALRTFDMN